MNSSPLADRAWKMSFHSKLVIFRVCMNLSDGITHLRFLGWWRYLVAALAFHLVEWAKSRRWSDTGDNVVNFGSSTANTWIFTSKTGETWGFNMTGWWLKQPL
jgi:hypothetical protein